MAKSKNLTSGQFPTMGASEALGAKPARVIGARPMAKKGVDKSGNPSAVPHDLKGRRPTRAGTNGAQYGISVSRAYPASAEGRRNTHEVPSSHTEAESWKSAYAEFGEGATHGRR